MDASVHAPALPVIEVPDLGTLARATDLELVESVRVWSAQVRAAQTVVAAYAAEIDRRSSREAGSAGLAQRTGDRTSARLVARLTGTSGRESRDLVTAGRVLNDGAPWLGEVAASMRDGSLSVGAAAAIAAGLGEPAAHVAADDLLDAAVSLVRESPGVGADELARRARDVRTELDAAGVADREAHLYEQRSLRMTKRPDGMTTLYALLDPESSAYVTAAFDAVTSPRRGGPRFLDSESVARAEALETDPRTTEQIALDALVEMVRIASAADEGRIFGVHQPAVRVHIDSCDLLARTGSATIEGQHSPISTPSAERIACAGGYLPIVVAPDGSLDVGRRQRFFTSRQREALAAVWGGCAHPHCDRPPSWTEAHHVREWARGGPTDVANGVLLCKHHHLLVHNNGWTIRPPDRPGGRWYLAPPGGDPVNRETLELVPKNRVGRTVRARVVASA